MEGEINGQNEGERTTNDNSLNQPQTSSNQSTDVSPATPPPAPDAPQITVDPIPENKTPSQPPNVSGIYPAVEPVSNREYTGANYSITQDKPSSVNNPQQNLPPSQPLRGTPGEINGPFPSELGRWNWGAFFLNWIWAIANHVWIGLLALIGPIGLIMSVILALKGNEWAWKNRKFESIEQFKKVQRTWSIWGIALIPGLAVFSIIIVVILTVSSVGGAQSKSQDVRRMSDVRSLSKAIEMYVADNNKCPASLSAMGTTYIKVVPKDPETGKDYSYTSSSSKCLVSATLKNKDVHKYELSQDDNPSNGSIYDIAVAVTGQ